MGNHRFRLSDMIPNAWFHKLKETKPSNSNGKKKKPSDSLPHPSSSFYFSSRSHNCAQAPFQQISPRRSFIMRRAKRKTVYMPSPRPFRSPPPPPPPPPVSAGFTAGWSHSKSKISSLHNQDSSYCMFPALEVESSSESFLFRFYDGGDDDLIPPASFHDQPASWSRCSNLIISSSAEDIIIDVKDDAFMKTPPEEIEGLNSVSPKIEEPCPARNQANGMRKNHLSTKVTKGREERECKTQKKQKKPVSGGRRSFVNPPGIKLRVNSPRIQVSARRSVSHSQSKRVPDSFAVIKRSVDPKKDFRQSMLEMITENNITTSKDLEDLLACYLSLNTKEYHDVIIKAFEQIWFETAKLRLQ